MEEKIKTYAWDITEHLRTKEEMATYLNVVLEEGDPDLFVSAVGDIAKAQGVDLLPSLYRTKHHIL